MNVTVKKVPVEATGTPGHDLGHVILYPLGSRWGRAWEVRTVHDQVLGRIVRYEHAPPGKIKGDRLTYRAPRIVWMAQKPNGERRAHMATRNDALSYLIVKE